MTDKHSVHIKRLEVTFEVDQQAGDAAFATLFATHIRRWHDAVTRAEADRCFAEAERTAIGSRP